jgi:hypothetical protein
MARPHPLGELLLGEPELGSTHDYEPRECQTFLGGPVGGVWASMHSLKRTHRFRVISISRFRKT